VLVYISLGYNLRMSNITASLGVSQIRKVDFLIAERQRIARVYAEKISGSPVLRKNVRLLPVDPGVRHVYQLFSVRAECRDGLMKHLESLGIMTKIYFPPVHRTHFYSRSGERCGDLPVTETVAGDILSLPIYPGMPPEEADTIISGMASYYGGI